ncbi:hypothetical protein R5R35_003421 [Gryllus longicercus]|uniref:Uncharacterized protein n=1 Tax=Gryllus longicercus TaxID=2509291 RepID=A0AAN9VS89_9ORTH
MLHVPIEPPTTAEEMPPAVSNLSIRRVPQIMMALWTVFFFYGCIAVAVELVEKVEYYPQNITFAADTRGLIHVGNSSNTSAGLSGQFEFTEVVNLYNDSWNGVDVLSDRDQEEGAFNEVGDDDGTHSSQGFVTDKNKTASLSNCKGGGVVYNTLSEPELAEKEDSDSFTAGAATTGAVDGFKNNYTSASEPAFSEDVSSVGANSTSSNVDDGGTSKLTPVEVASINAPAAAPRAKSAGSTPLAARLASLVAAAPEGAKSPTRRSAVFWKVNVD